MAEEKEQKPFQKGKRIYVRALRDGFYEGIRRRRGDVFEAHENVKARWFEPTDPDEAAKYRTALEKASLAKLAAENKAREEKVKLDQKNQELERDRLKALKEAKEQADREAAAALASSTASKTAKEREAKAKADAEAKAKAKNKDDTSDLA